MFSPQCSRVYSRKEYVLRHQTTKKDQAHRHFRERRVDGLTEVDAAVPVGPSSRRSPSSSQSPTIDSETHATPFDTLPASLRPPAVPIHLGDVAESSHRDDSTPNATLDSGGFSQPSSLAQDIPACDLPLPPPLPLSVLAEPLPLPSPPPFGTAPPLNDFTAGWREEEDDVVPPPPSSTDESALIDCMALIELDLPPRQPNFAVLVLVGTTEEWEEDEEEDAIDGDEDAKRSAAGLWKEPSFYPDQ